MTSIPEILDELRANNGSNYKMDVLRKHKDNELLQRVLKMTYDKVDFTFGVSMLHWHRNGIPDTISASMELADALDSLENDLAKRAITGNDALDQVTHIFQSLMPEDQQVIAGILNRDLRINMGRSNINKVFKGLIVKPVYMRCGLFSKKTAGKVNPEGSFVQLKADGTYREFTVENGEVITISRSGEAYDYPALNQTLSTYPDGHYIGELTVRGEDGNILDRATGNGFINSSDPPHDRIVLDLWDYVTLEEYTGAANKVKGTTPYHERFARLQEIVGSELSPTPANINVIPTYIVNSVSEALQHCTAWMEEGLEGAIWKDRDAIFRDGTSPQQLKLKLEIDADVRITGFKPGTVGTKREGKIGSIEFATDDGKVKGFASGFTDDQLDDMDSRRNEILNAIMSVTCSDITKGRNNEHYALSHPRFNEIRTDKTETDTLERILETKEMAMAVGE